MFTQIAQKQGFLLQISDQSESQKGDTTITATQPQHYIKLEESSGCQINFFF